MNYNFNVELATKLKNVNQAIFLNNLGYWLKFNKATNKNFRDGYYWSYNTISSLAELFPFWTEKQIRTIIDNLIAKKIIIKRKYNSNKYNRTNWYTIDLKFAKKYFPEIIKKNSVKRTNNSNFPNGQINNNTSCDEEKTAETANNSNLPNGQHIRTEKANDITNIKQQIKNYKDKKRTEQNFDVSKKINPKLELNISFEEKTDKKQKKFSPSVSPEKSNYVSTVDFIKQNIEYDSMIQMHDTKIIDEILLNLLEMYLVDNLKIAGTDRPTELLKSVVSKIGPGHIDYLANKYNNIDTKIKNKKAYLQTMIYNTAFEVEIDTKQFLANNVYGGDNIDNT